MLTQDQFIAIIKIRMHFTGNSYDECVKMTNEDIDELNIEYIRQTKKCSPQEYFDYLDNIMVVSNLSFDDCPYITDDKLKQLIKIPTN